MAEHALFTAHLLDPEEEELIENVMKMSRTFSHLDKGTTANIVSAIIRESSTTVGALIQNPETDPILSAAETILDFDTKSAQDVAAARITSIIDPRLADHDRRETVKFVDELKRAILPLDDLHQINPKDPNHHWLICFFHYSLHI